MVNVSVWQHHGPPLHQRCTIFSLFFLFMLRLIKQKIQNPVDLHCINMCVEVIIEQPLFDGDNDVEAK